MFKSVLATTVLVGGLTVASPAAGGATTTAFVGSMADKPIITAGQTVTVSTTLTQNGSPLEAQTVSLYAKPAGASDYSFVIEKTTNSVGKASALHLPQKNTDYQWRCDKGDACPATPDSSVVQVGVKTKVTMQLQDSSISPGQKMIALGTTTPNKAGATATVWRIRITGRTEKWFSGTVRDNGTFRLAKVVPGTVKYKVYVVVAAWDGNMKGTSPTRTLYVR